MLQLDFEDWGTYVPFEFKEKTFWEEFFSQEFKTTVI